MSGPSNGRDLTDDGWPGPYATAILRFYISFPDTYPALPPLVTFSTDMFHPLITPLTTYMYTTDIQEGGTVSATDEERLPPGGFSLRHGFPGWFGRGSKAKPAGSGGGPQHPPTTPRSSREPAGDDESNASTPNSGIAATGSSPSSAGGRDDDDDDDVVGDIGARVSGGGGGGGGGGLGVGVAQMFRQSFRDVHKRDTLAYEVLSYVRSTFDEEDVLDSVPLEAAGNPGAWHAWRTHRGHTTVPEGETAAREPGEWNWEGVWEERVKRNIQASLSEPVLYGEAGGDDTVRHPITPCAFELVIHFADTKLRQIRFLNMEDTEVETVIDNLYKTMGQSARADPLVVPSVNL